MSRKLASVQVIKNLTPIAKADRIETATVLGWRVVVKKGEFNIGDKCIFFEVDSILPPLPEFSFLEQSNYRLRTVQLRGQLSQGLVMPMNILDSFEKHWKAEGKTKACPLIFNEGDDLTELLEIEKYEPEPVDLGHGITGLPFPSEHVSHTDLERIQNKPELIEELKGHRAYALQKIDGWSFTAILDIDNDEFLVASSDTLITRDYPEAKNKFLTIAEQFNVRNKLMALHNEMINPMLVRSHVDIPPHSVAIQCEIAGEEIRKNRMGLKGKHLFLFNVAYVTDNKYYLNYPDLLLASEIIGIPMPKTVFNDFFEFKTVDELLEFAGKDTYPNGHPQEGVVFKPLVEMYSEALCGRLQFKVLNNKYLMKIGE